MAAISSTELERLRDLFCCPISYELYKDPVIDRVCGHVFEKIFIEQWLTDNETCPISRNSLNIDQLETYTVVKDACALLNPERVAPLTEEDLELLRSAEISFLTRERPPRASEEIHASVMEKVAEKIKAYSNAYHGSESCC